MDVLGKVIVSLSYIQTPPAEAGFPVTGDIPERLDILWCCVSSIKRSIQ